MGKGLVGLVTKPVIGVIDLGTKTFEGVKNNFEREEDQPNSKR